jgi:hypothetical protein
MEMELKIKYIDFKFEPSLSFDGRYECFSIDLPINKIIEELKKC